MALQYRDIVRQQEKEYFLRRFIDQVGVKVPLAYLNGARIIGAYDSDSHLVGGYAMVFGPVFRTLLFIPDDVKRTSPFLQSSPPESFLEVNCAWLSPEIQSNVEAVRFWLHIRKDILAANRNYILVMYNKRVSYLRKFYSRTHPHKIYEGPAQVRAGDKTHDEVFVGYVTMFDLRMALVRNLYSFVRRIVARRLRGHTEPSFPEKARA